MKKIFQIQAAFVLLILAGITILTTDSSAQTAPLRPIFYLHGFTAGPAQIDPLAVEMASNHHFNWTNKGEEPTYYSALFTPNVNIPTAAIIAKLQLIHPSDYIGVGYSAGGLLGRSIVHSTAGTAFMHGLVTIDAPHRGAYMADFWYRQNFAFNFTAAQGQINRADWSFLSTTAALVVQALFWIPVTIANAIDQVINTFMADMKENSTYLNNINAPGAPPQTAEANLFANAGGIASCWGSVSAPLSPAYNAPDNNFASKQNDYFNKIQSARDKSHQYDQEADRLHSKLHWWNAVVMWPRIWWNRTRAGDYHASADGIIAANDAWEQAIGTFAGGGGRQASDAFILANSQHGDPAVPSNRWFQLNSDGNGNCTHGTAIYNYGNNYNQIEFAMRTVGAQ